MIPLIQFHMLFCRCHCEKTIHTNDFASDLGCIDTNDDNRPLMSWESPALYENTG